MKGAKLSKVISNEIFLSEYRRKDLVMAVNAVRATNIRRGLRVAKLGLGYLTR